MNDNSESLTGKRSNEQMPAGQVHLPSLRHNNAQDFTLKIFNFLKLTLVQLALHSALFWKADTTPVTVS